MSHRIPIAAFAAVVVLLTGCTDSQSTTPDPTDTSTYLPVIGDSTYPVPKITEDVLFSDDGAVAVLNAFDTNQQDAKLQICADTAAVLSKMTDSEMQTRANQMSDYSWSTLQDLVSDCNTIAGDAQ